MDRNVMLRKTLPLSLWSSIDARAFGVLGIVNIRRMEGRYNDKIALLGWTDIITKLKGCDTDITEAIIYIAHNTMASKANQ